jgi:hypothetical protein
MSGRILGVIHDRQESAALDGIAALVAVARAERAVVRLAYFQPLPPARLGRHGRVVADTDREMARITCVTIDTVEAAARPYDDVTLETVVRFGSAGREALIEAEVFAPGLVVFFAARGGGPLARLRAWALRRRIARRPGVRVIVLEGPPARRTAVPSPAVVSRWRRDPARDSR